MSRSYKATGINLKGMPLGETDRLLTILTVERGLIRVIAPGARKHKSRLAGRSSQFVVNELFIVQGKQLDKLVQAETVRSFPALATDLAKLTASQYLAELALCQALMGQPQAELFALLVEHLQRLETATNSAVLACLSQGIFHLLALAGVAPEVRRCSVSQVKIVPDFTQPDWRIEFNPVSGGIVSLNQSSPSKVDKPLKKDRYTVRDGGHTSRYGRSQTPKATLITALELTLLQQLGQQELISSQPAIGLTADSEKTTLLWQRIERLLRQYAEHHFDRPIRSATLMDVCFPIAVPSE
ncbi:MAG: DNA repair protein RecO [Cyanobacteria bacterium J06638_20]